MVSDQTSEAGNKNYSTELPNRTFLRFMIRVQEDA